MMYRHKKGVTSGASQLFSVFCALMTTALCFASDVSSHADHPTSQATATERFSMALTGAPRTPTATTGWEFNCLDGIRLMPFEDPKTKAVVLIFISPDCPVANAYHPQLKKMDECFGPMGVRFFLVHSSQDISPAVAREHAAAFGLSIPVVLDADQSLARAVNATITPEAIVIARGRPSRIYRGAIDNRYAAYGKKRPVASQFFLQDALTSYLAGESIAVRKTKPVGCFISFDNPNPKSSYSNRHRATTIQ